MSKLSPLLEVRPPVTMRPADDRAYAESRISGHAVLGSRNEHDERDKACSALGGAGDAYGHPAVAVSIGESASAAHATPSANSVDTP